VVNVAVDDGAFYCVVCHTVFRRRYPQRAQYLSNTLNSMQCTVLVAAIAERVAVATASQHSLLLHDSQYKSTL
jgi:hypothetical protein